MELGIIMPAVVVLDRVLTILGEWTTSTWTSTERCPASKFASNPLYVVDIPQAAGNTIRPFHSGVATDGPTKTRLMPRDGY